MKCPACGTDTRVSNSRPNENNTLVRRRRICQNNRCDNRFSTVERLVLKCKVTNLSGRQEPFDEAKLHRSVLIGLYDLSPAQQQAIADRVVAAITADLSGGAIASISSADLRLKAEGILRGIDDWLGDRYHFTAPSPNRGKTIAELQGDLFDDDDDD